MQAIPERWLLAPEYIERYIANTASLPVAAAEAEKADAAYVMVADTAVVAITGVLTKRQDFWSDTTSAQNIAVTVDQLAADPSVGAMLLVVDSPGGEVAGTAALGDAIARFTAQKPSVAYVEDCCCSAAYWVASQTGAIIANRTAITGSIGVVTMMMDFSKFLEDRGIKMHVVASSPVKAAGRVDVNELALTETQRLIDALHSEFKTAVLQGRPALEDTIDTVADGRVWTSEVAAEKGLIDGIGSITDAAELLAAMKGAGMKNLVEMVKGKFPQATLSEKPEDHAPDANSETRSVLMEMASELNALRLQAAEAQKTIATQAAVISELKESVEQVTGQSALAERTARVNSARREMRITPAEAETWVNLADQNPQAFDAAFGLVEARQPMRAVATLAMAKAGLGEVPRNASKADMFIATMNAHISAGMNGPDAMRKAAAENPDMAEAYNRETNQGLRGEA